MIIYIRDITIDLKANIVRTVCNTKTGACYSQHDFSKVSDYIFVNDIACYSAIQCIEAIAKGKPDWCEEQVETKEMFDAMNTLTEWMLLHDKD